ncbi:TPA: hypothetical protein HA265_04340, partial [Candidatus Woesearchaeota archaeon]|nr:hypothetical protein [Candidatus Woesearchaeota archaeon]
MMDRLDRIKKELDDLDRGLSSRHGQCKTSKKISLKGGHIQVGSFRCRKCFVVLMVVLAIALSYFLGPKITGYVVHEPNLMVYEQELGWVVNYGQTRDWEMSEHPAEFRLKAVKITGSLVGGTDATVYLRAPDGTRYLLLDRDSAMPERSIEGVTAYVVAVHNITAPISDQETIDEMAELSDIDTVAEDIPENSEQNELDRQISIDLTYQTGTAWDSDDDGFAYKEEDAVDFTVKDTQFSWEADRTRLCTKWTVIGEEGSTSVCHGAQDCCSLVTLAPSEESWDTPFYLYYRMHGAGDNSTVTAQVIYLDQNLEQGDVHFDSVQSGTAELEADFIDRPVMASFTDVCADTCALPEGVNATGYTLIFQLGSGTTIDVDSIKYVVEQTGSADIAEEVEVNVEVLDADGGLVPAVIEVKDKSRVTKARLNVNSKDRAEPKGKGPSSEGSFGIAAGNNNAVGLAKGKYDVDIN